MESSKKVYEEKLHHLKRDCSEANSQVDSLRQLIAEQNKQLMQLKTQTEQAINSREEINKEVALTYLYIFAFSHFLLGVEENF